MEDLHLAEVLRQREVEPDMPPTPRKNSSLRQAQPSTASSCYPRLRKEDRDPILPYSSTHSWEHGCVVKISPGIIGLVLDRVNSTPPVASDREVRSGSGESAVRSEVITSG